MLLLWGAVLRQHLSGLLWASVAVLTDQSLTQPGSRASLGAVAAAGKVCTAGLHHTMPIGAATAPVRHCRTSRTSAMLNLGMSHERQQGLPREQRAPRRDAVRKGLSAPQARTGGGSQKRNLKLQHRAA